MQFAFLNRIRRDGKLVELLRHSGMLYAAGVFTILFTFVQQITTANLLGVSTYGQFAVILSSSAFVLLVMDARTWEIGTKLLARPVLDNNYQEVIRVMTWLTLVDIILGVIGTIIILVFARQIALYLLKMPDLDWLVRLYGVSLPFRIVGSGAPIALVRLYNRFDWLSIKSVSYAVIRLVLISGAAWLGFGLVGVVVVAILCEVINMLVLLLITFLIWRRHLSDAPFFDFSKPQNFKEGRVMLFKFWVFATLKGLQMESFIPISALLTTSSQIGLLRSGVDIGDLINRLVTPITVVISPNIIKTYEQGSKSAFLRLIKQSTIILSIITVPLVLGIVVFGPTVFPSLLGSGYENVTLVAIFMALGFGVNAIFIWSRAGMIAMNLINEQNLLSLIIMLLTILGLLIFVPSFGAVGSAAVVGVLLAVFSIMSTAIFFYRLAQKSEALLQDNGD